MRLNDSERLIALGASGLLNRTEDQRLRTLCMTAVSLLECSQSHVNVLDGSHQFHVASYPPVGRNEPTPVEDTGCKLVVAAEQPVLVPDTLLHPEVCSAEWVVAWGTRAYLGVPIWYHGQVLGSFCVTDIKPRDWQPWHVLTLEALAKTAGLSTER